jgi:uncharacterized protein YjbI with pentapeptide repeats
MSQATSSPAGTGIHRALALLRLRPAMACAVVAGGLAALPIEASAMNCKTDATPSVDWHECDKSMLLLSGADLSGANLADADFSSTDFGGANLTGANLEKATLARASLAGATADKANFARIEGYRANFSGASAQGASFASAEGERIDFTGANLTGADFAKAELGRANFQKATITGARFPFANLSRADFTNAVFTGPLDFQMAFVFLTRFEGVDLSAAKGLQQWQVDLTCGDANTKLPAGLTPAKSWPCKFD